MKKMILAVALLLTGIVSARGAGTAAPAERLGFF